MKRSSVVLFVITLFSGSIGVAQNSALLPAATARLDNLIPQWIEWSMKMATYTPDGKQIVFGGDDLVVFESSSRRFAKQIGSARDPITALAFSPDGKRLAVEYNKTGRSARNIEHEIVIWNYPEGTERVRFQGVMTSANNRRTLVFSPDGTKLATYNDTEIKVLSAENGAEVWAWKADAKTSANWSYSGFDVTPDWSYFLFKLQRIAYPSGASSPAIPFEVKKNEKAFFGQNWISPDGARAVAVSADGTLKKLFDLNTGAELKQISGFGFTGAAINKAFDRLASVNGLWLINENREVPYCANYNNSTQACVAFNPVKNEATASFYYLNLDVLPEKPDIFWAKRANFKGPPYVGRWFAGDSQNNITYGFDPVDNRRVIATWGWSGTRGFNVDTLNWDAESKRIGYDSSFGENNLVSNAKGTLALSRDGRILHPAVEKREPQRFLPEGKKVRWLFGFVGDEGIYYDIGNILYLTSIGQTEVVRSIELKNQDSLESVTPSPDGRQVALSIRDRDSNYRFEIYATATGLNPYAGRSFVGGMVFDSAGKYWARYEHKKIEIYDRTTGELLDSWYVESGGIWQLAFSADGELLVITNHNGRNEVIQRSTKKTLATLVATAPLGDVAAFGPDGQMIAPTQSSRLFFYEPVKP